jgi:hypothetical protein
MKIKQVKYKFSSTEFSAKVNTLPNGIYFYRLIVLDGKDKVSKVGKKVTGNRLFEILNWKFSLC